MSNRTFAGWLSFTLYFGAAMNDATLEQRTRFNAEIPPLLKRMRANDPAVWKPAAVKMMTTVSEIMGPDWEPQGDWKNQIDILLGRE